MAVDKELRREICREVREAMRRALEVKDEVWLTEQQVAETFPTLTRDILKNYGCRLPRTRVSVIDDEGRERQGRWMYGKHAIQRMIDDKTITCIRVRRLGKPAHTWD